LKNLATLIESQIFRRGTLPIWTMIPKVERLEYPTFSVYSVSWALAVIVFHTPERPEVGTLPPPYVRGSLEPN
jgi:hypothetical protein